MNKNRIGMMGFGPVGRLPIAALALGCVALCLARAAAGAGDAAGDGAWPEPKQILVWSQERRLRAFSDYAGTFPTRAIRAGGRAYPLPRAPRDLSALYYELDGRRYGLDGRQAATLAEIGRALGLTPPRVHQLHGKALEVLRNDRRFQHPAR